MGIEGLGTSVELCRQPRIRVQNTSSENAHYNHAHSLTSLVRRHATHPHSLAGTLSFTQKMPLH